MASRAAPFPWAHSELHLHPEPMFSCAWSTACSIGRDLGSAHTLCDGPCVGGSQFSLPLGQGTVTLLNSTEKNKAGPCPPGAASPLTEMDNQVEDRTNLWSLGKMAETVGRENAGKLHGGSTLEPFFEGTGRILQGKGQRICKSEDPGIDSETLKLGK